MISFSGKKSIIIGAGGGIGRAISLKLAQTQSTLYLLDRNVERLEETAELARNHGAEAKTYEVDLGVESSICQTLQQLKRDTTQLDILVNCAGAYTSGKIAEAEGDDFDLLYKINVKGPFLMFKHLSPMFTEKPGHIVMINSSTALSAKGNLSQYSAVQHAAKALTDSLRAEVNEQGIKVTTFYLGRTATPMMDRIFAAEGKSYNADLLLQPEDIADTVLHTISLPLTAEITDIHLRPFVKSY